MKFILKRFLKNDFQHEIVMVTGNILKFLAIFLAYLNQKRSTFKIQIK